MTAPTIGELVEVVPVETVVRLDGPGGKLAELVLTGDVVASLSEVLRVASQGAGAGFFVVGPFGSGKSHFLAALGELLADPAGTAGAARRAGWAPALERLAAEAHPYLPVRVPLVEYRAEASLEDVVLARARRALDSYGGGAPDPGAADGDRLASWDAVLEEARAGGGHGVILLVDELSEFLKAKQGPALTEDLRFLQFLGEWAMTRPVVVCCALQESIEEVANVSSRELARIRDRYRPSLALSMRHVEDLVRGRLVRLRPGAEEWVARAQAEAAAALPAGAGVLDPERFARCYPLHPGTLELLEGLKFLLSQSRGVVDFICRQVSSDLGHGYGELVTPERVYDHFAARLSERPETARLAATVLPYYERALPELVEGDDSELALRTVKLLTLLAASPLERPRSAAELASLLLVRVSTLEPEANAAYLEQAVLEPLVTRGAYLVREAGPPARYRVELGADAALVARERVAAVRSELSPADRRLVATLAALGSSPSLPLQLLAEVGYAKRELLWQNTLRSLLVGPARVLELTGAEAAGLADRARRAGAEGCLVIGEVEPAEAAELVAHARALFAAGLDDRNTARLSIWLPAPLTSEELETLLELQSRRLALSQARDEGRDDVAEQLAQAGEGDEARAREVLRRVYFGGQVVYPEPAGGGATLPLSGVDLPSLAGLSFERQLPHLAEPLLSGLHPRHLEVAPRGELVGDRMVNRLISEVIARGRLGPAAVAQSQLAAPVNGYLAPLGIARARNDGVTVAPDPQRSPAVAEVLRLVGEGEAVLSSEVAAALADGPFGLCEAETLLVLNACVQAGLLECWRGRRNLEAPFLALGASDRLAAGELVEPAVRAAIARLGAIAGPGPFEPWSSSTQGAAWEHARSWLAARRERIAEVRAGLSALEDLPTLGGADTAPALSDLALVGALVDAVDTSASATAGLRELASTVAAVGEVTRLLEASRRLEALARFFRDELRRFDAAAAYLTHPELVIPEELAPLAELRERAVGLLGQILELAAEDRLAELASANRELRSAYLAAYEEGHDRYYSAVGPAELQRVGSDPRYRALAALSAVGAVAVPDDRVKVDRLIAAGAPAPCRRRADLELAWKPRCDCGFALGTPPRRFDGKAVLALAASGVRQHLAELTRPEHAARLHEAGSDLVALGQVELAADLERLLALAAEPAEPDQAGPRCSELAGLLGGELAKVLRDVLGGGQLIVARDLATLREDLIGRRFPKRRLLELVSSWLDPDGVLQPGSFVEIVDSSEDGEGPPAGGPGAGAGAGAGMTAPAAGVASPGGGEAVLGARGAAPSEGAPGLPGTRAALGLDARSVRGWAGEDARAGDARAGDARAGDARAGDARAGDARAGDARAGDDGAGEDARAGDARAGVSAAGWTGPGDDGRDWAAPTTPGARLGAPRAEAARPAAARPAAASGRNRRQPAGVSSATGAVLAERYPGLASLLPYHQQADAFWLAAWWTGRPAAPSWLPASLLAEGRRLAEAAEAARSNMGALGELSDLDARVRADTVLGGEVAAALDAGGLGLAAAMAVIEDERLLRLPVRLAAGQLARLLPGGWQAAERLGELDAARAAARHALLAPAELQPLALLLGAARHAAAVERSLPGASCAELVEELYPRHLAPAAELASRAALAGAGQGLLDDGDVASFRAGLGRLARDVQTAFDRHAEAGFPGCLAVHDIGREVVAQLLTANGRVAVLLVDAMRADLSERVVASLREVLPGRPVVVRWAVVPAPTRTKESLAALSLGRPVPAGSAPGACDGTDGVAVPFTHLGYESAIVVGADRDHRAGELAELWRGAAPLSIAVATGVDERLHRTSVEPAALLDEAATGLGRRVLPSLAALPASVPLVVLADHGFRENPSWGRGPEGRYVHGGSSLEECVVPVVTFGPSR